jgi:hypothetical protein
MPSFEEAPVRNPSVSTSLLVHPDDTYDTPHAWIDGGQTYAAVGFDAGGASHGTIQGPPAALRKLAAALIQAAHHADAACPADQPAPVIEATR